MKKVIAVIILIVLLVVGGGIVGYPFISNYLMSQNLDSEVQSYLNSASQLSQDQYDEELEKAKKYNEGLIGNVNVGDPFGEQPETDDNYYDLLNVNGTSVMAVIEIPAIDVRYPVYHGTGKSVLDKGVGHLKNTSLPIGGKGTHSVLTGHTGYSQAKLFTDLDKLENGDVFYITVLKETHAYQVDQIKVVLPTDTSDLQIDSEEDYVTLVTCTPYGVNSHRLLVRGTRIPFVESEKEKSEPVSVTKSTWNDEYMSAIIIGSSVMIGILIVYVLIRVVIKQIRKRKCNE
ncbi:MAG: class C sortase [Ruminococcus sp.]|nr:class C sortase [Ruminococcus sp.]